MTDWRDCTVLIPAGLRFACAAARRSAIVGLAASSLAGLTASCVSTFRIAYLSAIVGCGYASDGTPCFVILLARSVALALS